MTERAPIGDAPERRQPTTGEALRQAAQRWPEETAVILDGARLTYAELYDLSLLQARALAALGAGPGHHVGILMPNSIDYILLFYACGLIGATALTINARYREDDLAYVLDQADVGVLFIGGHALPYQDFRTMLRAIHPELETWDGIAPLALRRAPKLTRIVNLSDPRETVWPGRDRFLAGAAKVPRDAVEGMSEAVPDTGIALMMFSSGTTARPKACMLTHRSLAFTGAALAERFRLAPGDRFYNPLPFFHMSTMLPMAACRASGAAHVATMHFDAAAGLDAMERERATIAYVSFPTVISQLIGHESFPRRDLSSLRIVHSVGPADLLRRYAAAFPQAYFVNAYGLTEATGVPVYSDPGDPQEVSLVTSGRPFDGVTVRAFDPDTQEMLPPGARGELRLRGPCLFEGYYKDPEGTARVLTPDGWLRSGDIGSVDEAGRVTYSGRLKDMLKIGGENVAALEIESFLCTHPDIALAQVIGVPDEHLFEAAAAFVELKAGARLTEADVARHCVGRIASYKVPRYVRIVTDWPMSTTKIQKFRLAEGFVPERRLEPRDLGTP